jgi:hypothetical protein
MSSAILDYLHFKLSGSKVTCQSYIPLSFVVYILGKYSCPCSVLSEVPQCYTLGPLFFNVFINNLCAEINYSRFLYLLMIRKYIET